jgi:hypothetical protein
MHPSVHPQDNWKNAAQNCAPKVRLGKKMEGKKRKNKQQIFTLGTANGKLLVKSAVWLHHSARVVASYHYGTEECPLNIF